MACVTGTRDPTKKSPSTKSAKSALGWGFSDGGMRKPRVYKSICQDFHAIPHLFLKILNTEHPTSQARETLAVALAHPRPSLSTGRTQEPLVVAMFFKVSKTLLEQAFPRILVLARIPTRAWRSLRPRSRERGSPRKIEGCGSPCRAEDPQMWIPSLENT